jgi:hypothetical protein
MKRANLEGESEIQKEMIVNMWPMGAHWDENIMEVSI